VFIALNGKSYASGYGDLFSTFLFTTSSIRSKSMLSQAIALAGAQRKKINVFDVNVEN